MARATDILKGAGHATRVADVVLLDYDLRHRRRISLKAQGGLGFLLDLPNVPDLRDGDALILDDGRLVLVQAAPEALMELTCTDAHHIARLAWHIGNRHLPAEIHEHAIRIRADHVIADMARGLGASVSELLAPFDPEKGAYHGAAARHGYHRQGNGHDH